MPFFKYMNTNSPAVRYSDPHLSAQPHLPRYYCNDVYFNNHQSAVESKTGKDFIRYHGYQSLRDPFRECVKVRVDQRCEAFDAPPPPEMVMTHGGGGGGGEYWMPILNTKILHLVPDKL